MSKNYNDLIKAQDLKKRRKEILELSAKSNIGIGLSEAVYLNEIILLATKSILSKKGKKYFVVSGESEFNNLGDCYFNAVRMMDKHGYVEGCAINKNNSLKIAHAWNVDRKGNHIDFTLSNAEDYDYFGIVIPEKTVYEVGAKNGHIWFAALPFIDNL